MKNFKYICWIFLLVGIDQGSKFYAHQHFESPVKILDFFQLKLVQNSGIAFSLPVPQWIVLSLTVFVLLGIGYQLFFKKEKAISAGIAVLVFSGAVGNLIDRVAYGKVTDFLAFWDFPIFNGADIFISLGIAWFFFDEVFAK